MGDGETPTVAESRALHNAKRMAVEQAGTYLQSYTKTKNFQLTNDELEMVAGALVEIEILEKKRTVVGEGIRFSVKIKATVTPDKAGELVARLKQKRTEPGLNQVQQYKDLRDSYDRLSKEMEDLKRRFAHPTSEAEKNQTVDEIARNELESTVLGHAVVASFLIQGGTKQNLAEALSYLSQAIEELKGGEQRGLYLIKDRDLKRNIYGLRGYVFFMQDRYEQAISDYSEAIKLHPGKVIYYVRRAASYDAIGQYKQAASDWTEAIKIGVPEEHEAIVYYARGSTYVQLEQDDEAIRDLTKVIQLSPTSPLAFRALYKRGITYNIQNKWALAIADFSEAMKLDLTRDQREMVTLLRGQAYSGLGQTSAAIADFTEVIRLEEREKVHDEHLAEAYTERGYEYYALGKASLALSDFNAAIRLAPKNGRAYFGRGGVYLLNQSEERATADIRRSCDFGFDPACQFLIQRR